MAMKIMIKRVMIKVVIMPDKVWLIGSFGSLGWE